MIRQILKLSAVLALTAGMAAGAQAKEWKEVRIGTEGAYAPFNFFDSNKELQSAFAISTSKPCNSLL
ncbi:MAG: hypothetical protein AAFO62_13740, partial [Pseudomonadota bacterium]